MTESEEDAAFVRAIVDLGHALDMRIQPEGVETAAALELALCPINSTPG